MMLQQEVARSVFGSGSSVSAGGEVVALAWDGAVSMLEVLGPAGVLPVALLSPAAWVGED